MTERKQLKFNFKRGAKLAIINKIMHRNVLNSRMLLALRAIDDRARDEALVTMTYNEIAEFLHMSRPTAKRGVAELIECDLLSKKPVVNHRGKQANEYQLIWSNLQSIADGEPLVKSAPVRSQMQADDESETPAPDLEYESSQVVNPATGQNEADPGHSEPSTGSHRPPDPGHHDPSFLIPLSRINNLPPSYNPTWGEVEEFLILMGVGCAARAVNTARDRGYSSAEVLKLIRYANSKPGAYGPGAIYDRIRYGIVSDDSTSGWPGESEEFLKAQSKIQAEAKYNRATKEALKRREKIEQQKHALQDLERDYGPVLDHMDRYEFRTFAAAHLGNMFAGSLARDPDSYRSDGFYRPMLLKALERQATGVPGDSKSADAVGSASADRK